MVAKNEVVAAEFYQGYIRAAGEGDIHKDLEKNTKQFKKFLKKIPKGKFDYSYAEGKWTTKTMLQHILDAERVFAYRALRFARKDATPLPSFDENSWAAHAPVAGRDWDDLVEEFKALRKSTELLFSSFNDEQLRSVGTASGQPVNVLALGYIC